MATVHEFKYIKGVPRKSIFLRKLPGRQLLDKRICGYESVKFSNTTHEVQISQCMK